MTTKHLKGSVWKYFELWTVNGKVMKEKAVCRQHNKPVTEEIVGKAG